MRTDVRIALCVCLALLGAGACAEEQISKDGVPLDSPGLRLPEGTGFEVLGGTDRISGPDAVALAALQSDEQVVCEDQPDWIIFRPRGAIRGGVIFYPGAESDVKAYAAPLREVARHGYLTVAVRMPRYLAMLGTGRAADVMKAFPDVPRWALVGHSMGGPAAAIYATRHPDTVGAVVLWDAYIMKPADLSSGKVPVMLIHRADEKGAPPERFSRQDGLVPPDLEKVPIIGASHMQFGNFIPAAHRLPEPATISVTDQQAKIVAATVRFLDTRLIPGG
ncbi:MAG: alpha/beta hydrolase [Gammaproteobacteria bacterium]|nr:alpha/beta hydrolase [Gammaproteobacteria bacterium]MDH5274819.1 alpha/beta hydrolase [Gammaproteobacteria bacterium]